MPDDDALIGQNEVDVRNEARRPSHEKLSTIGYDVVLIDQLAGKIHRLVECEHDHTPLRRSRRGRWFEVKLPDSRIARVTIELDRVDPDV